jgi:ribonuclease BN (tRNA processing enzyme)
MEQRHLDRRRFIGGAAALAALAAIPRRGLAQAQAKTRLILLGTKGGPSAAPMTGRHLPSQVILIKGVPYVVDCGLGVTEQLVRARVDLRQLRHILITHHHSDHDLDYGNLIYTAWASGLATPVDAWGPPPLAAMTRSYFELNKYDIDTRIADEGRPDLRGMVRVHEFSAGGVVLQNDDVTVTAALVPHPPVTPNFGYRFDAADRSIVISGDTAYSEAVVALARDADVLVHEAMYQPGIERLAQRIGNGARLLEHLRAAHTVTEDVGRVAAAAKVKLLVLSHLVPGDDPSITEEMWIAGARQHYDGPIVVGRDLLEV